MGKIKRSRPRSQRIREAVENKLVCSCGAQVEISREREPRHFRKLYPVKCPRCGLHLEPTAQESD